MIDVNSKVRNLLSSLRKRGGNRPWLSEFVSKLVASIPNIPRLCPWCQSILKLDTLSIDHKKPLSRGGTNKRHNLEAVCLRCNKEKGALTSEEFRHLLTSMERYPEGLKIVRTRLRQASFMYRG